MSILEHGSDSDENIIVTENLSTCTIYVYKIDNSNEDFFKRIRDLYQMLKDRNLFDQIMEQGMYAITDLDDKGEKQYYVGCKKQFEGSKPIEIKSGVYVASKPIADTQDRIVSEMTQIYNSLSCQGIRYKENYSIEKYLQNGNCIVYIPLTFELQNIKYQETKINAMDVGKIGVTGPIGEIEKTQKLIEKANFFSQFNHSDDNRLL